MPDPSWPEIVRLVHERAQFRCEYCQTAQAITGQAMHVDHILPTGPDTPDNLCLACANCNLSKSAAIEATDPETDQIVPLFHPRLQQWGAHFEWVLGGAIVRGRTPIGRATVERLRMNQGRVVDARVLWVATGLHPPD